MVYCREDGSASRRRARADVELGERIRARREKLGLSQDKVAEELGWFAAQVDDCENGLFRPPSRDLFLLADLLGVEVSYFHDGAKRPLPKPEDQPEQALPRIESAIGFPQELHGHSGAIELFCVYARIHDARKRAMLLDLAESFARDS
jgi:transcriptional regulator with XRE-family HTH domain